VGRSAGFLRIAASTSGRMPASSPPSRGGSWTVRYIRMWAGASPNGWRPVPAYTTRQPQAKTSAAVVTSSLAACSGAMKAGVPRCPRLLLRPVVASRARAIPKSMTFGPVGDISTFDGFRSRWMIPAR
jgi:hypothetical protein